MDINGIIFDLDGVLIDSHNAVVLSIMNTLKTMNLPLKDQIFETLYKSHKQVFVDVYPESRELVETFDKLYINDPMNFEKVKILPNVHEVLLFLNKTRVKMGIVTTKDRFRTNKILLKIQNQFEVVVTCDDTEKTRPDPAPINLALEKLQLDKNKTLYVGDTPLDIVQAKKAGVISVAISTGRYDADTLKKGKPHFLIQNFIQLNDLIKGGRD